MSARFFCSSPVDGPRTVLTDAEAHHLLHVMRAAVGDEVTVFDGSGCEFTARVVRLLRATVELEIVERHEIDRELPRPVRLAAPLPKGDRQRWLVEKLVELGTTSFTPLVTARSVAKPEPSSLDRLRRTVIEASKQCGRNRLLEIRPPIAAAELFTQSDASAVRILAHLDPEMAADETRIDDLFTSNPSQPVTIAVGPEGGWTDDEVALAKSHGWHCVSLGARILRLETAALVLVSSVALPSALSGRAVKVVPATPALNIVLYQPEIPPNTGAVGRTCVAVGAKLWLVRPLGFRVDEKTLRRAGLDYWEHLDWEVVDDWQALANRLPVDRAWYFTKSAAHGLYDASFVRGDVLVFGSETAGLPPSLLQRHAERTLRIPLRPQVRSLNLSNAVAVAAYEAVRQWHAAGDPLDEFRLPD